MVFSMNFILALALMASLAFVARIIASSDHPLAKFATIAIAAGAILSLVAGLIVSSVWMIAIPVPLLLGSAIGAATRFMRDRFDGKR